MTPTRTETGFTMQPIRRDKEDPDLLLVERCSHSPIIRRVEQHYASRVEPHYAKRRFFTTGEVG